MTNLEQNQDSIEWSLLEDLKAVDADLVSFSSTNEALSSSEFVDEMESMDLSKETVDSVLTKVEKLKETESLLRDESEYRATLANYAERLEKYSQKIEKTKEGLRNQIDYGSPDKKKVKSFEKEFKDYADKAKEIEKELKNMEKEINKLKKDQDLNDELIELEKENEELKHRLSNSPAEKAPAEKAQPEKAQAERPKAEKAVPVEEDESLERPVYDKLAPEESH